MTDLLIVKDMSLYNQGTYYEDWRKYLNAYKLREISPSNYFDLEKNVAKIFFSHSVHDFYVSLFNKKKDIFNKLAYNLVSKLRIKSSQKRIFFSKNDYKFFDEKINTIKNLNCTTVITHSKKSIPFFKNVIPDIRWVPFGLNPQKFYYNNELKFIDIGFRGNLNGQWNNEIRKFYLRKLELYKSTLNVDIVESTHGENFISNDRYRRWISSCKVVFNTESAFETVGPKWYEQMACEAVPIAPIAKYEGLLLPWKNYIPIDELSFKDVNNVLSDLNLLNSIRAENLRLVSNFTIDKIIDNYLSDLFEESR
jgi:hypothetical protein